MNRSPCEPRNDGRSYVAEEDVVVQPDCISHLPSDRREEPYLGLSYRFKLPRSMLENIDNDAAQVVQPSPCSCISHDMVEETAPELRYNVASDIATSSAGLSYVLLVRPKYDDGISIELDQNCYGQDAEGYCYGSENSRDVEFTMSDYKIKVFTEKNFMFVVHIG